MSPGPTGPKLARLRELLRKGYAVSIPIVCPNGHRANLPEWQAGRLYRCPLCFAAVEVPARNGQPLGPEDQQSLVAPERRAEAERDAARIRHGLAWVYQGLGVHYARVLVLLFTTLLELSRVIFESFTEEQTEELVILRVLAWVVVAGSVAGPLLGLIGSAVCLKAPREVGGRGFIWFAMACDLAALLLAAAVGLGLAPEDLDEYSAVAVGSLGFQLASGGFFLFFLSELGAYFDAYAFSDEALWIVGRGFYLLLAALVGGVVLLGLHHFVFGLRRFRFVRFLELPLLMVLIILLFIGFVPIAFRQVTLLSNLREVVRKKA